ncbi:MAG: hypothetical protein GC151_17570 [Betaproteobacteria bacterium]|nr:hypothetical protein [Betaproteobacteria bacterium]
MLSDRVYAVFERLTTKLLGGALRLGVRFNREQRRTIMANKAAEALAPVELGRMIESLGIAVATANKKLLEATPDLPSTMVIDSAQIDLKVAISVDESTTTSAGGELKLQAFNVNASYSRTYGFKEEASSQITIHLQARPQVQAS